MPPKAQHIPTLVDDSPAAVQQRANTASIAEYELPKTTLAKLAKGSVGPDANQVVEAHTCHAGSRQRQDAARGGPGSHAIFHAVHQLSEWVLLHRTSDMLRKR